MPLLNGSAISLSNLEFEFMFGLFSILLTEIKVMGLSARAPFLLYPRLVFIFPFYCLLLFGICLIYANYALVELTFEKINAVTYILITSGAFIMIRTKIKISDRAIQFTSVLLLFVFIAQTLHMFPLLEVFASKPDKVRGSFTGFSSEPSFFAWFLLWLYATSETRRTKIFFVLPLFILSVLFGATITMVFAFLLYEFIRSIYRISNNQSIRLLFLLTFILGYSAIDLVIRFTTDTSIGHYLYFNAQSWREISHFASLIGAFVNNESFPSLGNWSSIIISGQTLLTTHAPLNFIVMQGRNNLYPTF